MKSAKRKKQPSFGEKMKAVKAAKEAELTATQLSQSKLNQTTEKIKQAQGVDDRSRVSRLS